MSEFLYFVSFYIQDEDLNIQISVKLDNFIVPTFIRTFDKTILDNKDEFSYIYEQISEYFYLTRLNMTKSDFILFYNTIRKWALPLPKIINIHLVEERLKIEFDLTPKEILYLLYLDGKQVNGKVAKIYEEYYHLDTDYTSDKLLRLGYVTTSDTLYNIHKSTKKDLMTLLNEKNNNLKKEEIIQMVLDKFSEDKLKKLFNGLFFKITNQGLLVEEEWKVLEEFNKSYYRLSNHLRIDEFYLYSIKYNNLTAKDVCKIMVLDKDKNDLTEFDWEQFFKEVNNRITNHNKSSKETVKEEVVQKEFPETNIRSTVNPPKVEEKKPTNDVDDVFNMILKKYSSAQSMDIKKVTDDDFLKVVNKQEVKVEQPKARELIPEKKVETPIQKNFEQKTISIPVVEENKSIEKEKSNLKTMFFNRFLLSSLLCVIIIYTLYSFVIE